MIGVRFNRTYAFQKGLGFKLKGNQLTEVGRQLQKTDNRNQFEKSTVF